MTLSLRRPNESLTALRSGFSARNVEFAELGRLLAEELRRRETPAVFRDDGICPLDVLALFAPERRLAVLNGEMRRGDRLRAAAVRLARAVIGRSAGAPLAVLDGEIAGWRSDPLLSGGSGMLEFVRRVLGGRREDEEGVEALLEEAATWRGMTLLGFVASGSTSRVYRVRYGGEECVLKLPRPGGEERFRRELGLLRSFDHPHLPGVRAWASDGAPYCVMERCRTGRAALRQAAERSGALLSALDYVHRSGVLHGDIRRSNLGIAPSGAPVLLDFSHARTAASPEEVAEETEKIKRLLA